MDLRQVIEQLSEVTATSDDGDHLVLLYQVQIIHSDGQIASPRQAAAYLATGEWEGSHPCMQEAECIHPAHVSPVRVTEEQLDQMVSRATRPSLATLYKKARSQGLVPASTGTGYF